MEGEEREGEREDEEGKRGREKKRLEELFQVEEGKETPKSKQIQALQYRDSLKKKRSSRNMELPALTLV